MPIVPSRRAPLGPRARGVVAVTAAAVLWGFVGIFVRLAAVNGLEVAFYRMCLGGALMCLLLPLTGRPLSLRLLRLCLPGGLFFATDMSLFFTAVDHTSVTDATVIGVLQPALVLLVAGPLLDERIGRGKVALTALAVAGAAVVVLGSRAGSGGAVGDLLACGSLLAFTGYWLVSKALRPKVDPLAYTGGVMIVGAVALAPVALLSGQVAGRVPLTAWLWIVVLAVGPGSGHLLINWSHRFLDASVSSVIVSINPIVAAVASLLVLAQPISALQVVGGLVAIAAIVAIARQQERPPLEGEPERAEPTG